ncbi:serine hydrolase domain-containing protein [Nonomuraea africana]|uniref:CubicO group peptidase (Beta-lactamase class C family) n=1 Tax=Nonomuraea africana TaxID=46171 RepID=A0ABR9KC38_9ACTN|nr:serine hydrolase domain-containing protein [Nonomuraea africana]MBE1559579.1 CubicO group peptidase (beta-lactamase class C family) [Nonomuraea africana]
MNEIQVQGTVAEGFEEVRQEFAAVVAKERGESGAQLAAYVRGRRVVDLWAGEEVSGESLTGVFSSTKGAATLVVALLVQDGVLGLDQTVAHYWPEFAAAGKGGITVRDVLTHRTGLVGAEGGFPLAELADDRLIAKRMAGQRPLWRPGSAHGYGGFVTFAIVGEVVRRVTGRSIQELFEERIRSPYGLDLYLGLPEALEPRYLPVLPWQAAPEQQAAFEANWVAPGAISPHSIAGISYNFSFFQPADVLDFPNHRIVRALGQASGGGVGSARGLAALYAAAISEVDGQAPLLEPETLAEFSMIHSTGKDLVGGERAQYALGFKAVGMSYPFLSANAIGHDGSAGSEAFADPITGVAYGYTRRRAAFGFHAPENHRLAAAVVRAATASA